MKTKAKINPRDGFTQSPWQSGIEERKALQSKVDATNVFDVLIVGAGITGVTTGLMLQKAGRKCIIVEAENIGFGTTGGTSAHLNTFFDATYPEIDSDFGEAASKQVADSGKEAFSIIKGFVDEYAIDCDFEYKEAYLFSEKDKETEQLKEILQSAEKAGVSVVESSRNGVPIPFEMALHFKKQGQFHPLKYITALANEFVKLGGVLLEHTFVSDSHKKDGVHEIQAGSLCLKALHLVYATHIPPGITSFNFRSAAYRSYVIAAKLKDDAYPEGLAYDMQEPYHYFRTHEFEGQKYLIIGGEDHKTGHGNPDEALTNLETYLRKYYEVEDIVYKWSSQYYVPVDGLPYIGKMGADDKTYVATGFNGNGMMFGTLSAKIITDQIIGIENGFSELYNPSRMKPVAGFSNFVKENADVAWHFIADRFTSKELDIISAIESGRGEVVDFQGEQLAIYKDDDGEVFALSPVCTHAGCIVSFNAVEKSWDCPCHGGRYNILGNVIAGPPRKRLRQVKLTKQMTKNIVQH